MMTYNSRDQLEESATRLLGASGLLRLCDMPCKQAALLLKLDSKGKRKGKGTPAGQAHIVSNVGHLPIAPPYFTKCWPVSAGLSFPMTVDLLQWRRRHFVAEST